MSYDHQTQHLPVLASTLYSLEQQRLKQQAQKDVFRSFKTGIDMNGNISCFRSGRVVGVAGVDALHVKACHLTHSLIATHLLSLGNTEAPSVYILEPPSTPADETSLWNTYEILRTRISQQRQRPSPLGKRKTQSSMQSYVSTNTEQPSDLETTVDALIARTSLLPYFDLIGISQALSEIADSLRQQQISSHSSPTQRTIVIIRSLSSTIANHISHAKNVTQTAALLTQVMRQIRRMANETPVLVLVELEVLEIEGGKSEAATVELRSAFSSPDGSRFGLGLGLGSEPEKGRSTGFGVDVGRGTLAKVVEAGIDVLVTVHDGFGVAGQEGKKCIVEVMKDRVGQALGEWAVWEE